MLTNMFIRRRLCKATHRIKLVPRCSAENHGLNLAVKQWDKQNNSLQGLGIATNAMATATITTRWATPSASSYLQSKD